MMTPEPSSSHGARRRSQLRTLLWIVAISSLLGAGFGGWLGSSYAGGSVAWGALQGLLTGAVISTWCGGFDLYLLERPFARPLRRAAFAVHVLVKEVWYVTGILLGLVGMELLFLPLRGGDDEPFASLGAAVVGSILVALAMNTVFSLNQLLGRGVLLNIVTGRYHRPRQEDRVFLFVDLAGSTRIAEEVGPLRFHALLNELFDEFTDPVLAYRGEIYRYVGDEMIVTWPIARGLRGGACVRCCFDMLDRLDDAGPRYETRYGRRPAVRAALHCGPVVVGEMGSAKREIVLLGDTVNTTARLEEAAREFRREVLISDDLLRRLELPDGIVAEPLGTPPIRGKATPVAVHSLTRLAAIPVTDAA